MLDALTYRNTPKISEYIELMKPRVMSLSIFTTLAGMIIAPGKLHFLTAFITILCTAIGAGSAGCFNMWYEKDIDLKMDRTKNRPIPRGAVDESDALFLAIITAIISTTIMAVFVNLISAFILLLSIFTYLFVYTIWLKRTSVQNIVIGGAAGAFPPMIGYAASADGITFDSILLFLIIFLWTPPHFWALALYKSDDYRKANIPMMPIVKGEKHTKVQILLYTAFTFIVSIIPYFTGFMGKFYLAPALALNCYFMYLSCKLYMSKNIKLAPKLFGYSIFYLFALFLCMIGDHLIL